MEVFNTNLRMLASILTQKQIAKDTGVSPSSIANYVAGTSEPSASFLLSLRRAYHINIDSFLTEPLKESNFTKSQDSSCDKFLGNYIVYYYNASAYKGKIDTYNSEVLNFGLISVFKDEFDNANQIKTLGLFMKSRREIENCLKTLNDAEGNCQKIKSFYDKYNDLYHGTIRQNSTEVFISLETENDNCLIILNNPPTSKKYIGGLGTVNSISRGREHAPCIQFILLSSHPLQIPDGEIYDMLSLGSGDIDVKGDAEDLIELFKKLYISDAGNGFNEAQKQRIIEDSLSVLASNIVNANMFRFAKVSDFEDDNYYRMIKDEIDD